MPYIKCSNLTFKTAAYKVICILLYVRGESIVWPLNSKTTSKLNPSTLAICGLLVKLMNFNELISKIVVAEDKFNTFLQFHLNLNCH